jgi:hypothetical protein
VSVWTQTLALLVDLFHDEASMRHAYNHGHSCNDVDVPFPSHDVSAAGHAVAVVVVAVAVVEMPLWMVVFAQREKRETSHLLRTTTLMRSKTGHNRRWLRGRAGAVLAAVGDQSN